MDIRQQKKLLNIQIDNRQDKANRVTLTHMCPVCGKHSISEFKEVGGGPLNEGEGYQFKGY